MREALRLTIGMGVVNAELVRRGAVVWAAQAEYATVEELTRAIAELGAAEGAPRGRHRVHVTLDPGIAQVRRLAEIPPVGERALGDMVALQSSRFFRRNGKPLVTDARWLERKKRNRKTVIAAAVEEPVLDAIAGGISAGGLAIGPIRPAGDEASRLRFRSRAAVSRRALELRRQARALLLLGAVAWLAAAVTGAVRIRNHSAAIRAEIAALEEPARAAIEARRALNEAAAAVDATPPRRALNEAAAAVDAIAATEAARGAMALRLAHAVDTLSDRSYLSNIDLLAEGK